MKKKTDFQKQRDEILRKFEELLSPGRNISLQIQQGLEALPKNYVVLLIVDLKEYTATAIELLKILKGQKGLYVTVNKPFEDLSKVFHDEGIEEKDIYFADAISSLTERKTTNAKNVVFLDSPADLIEISNIVSKAIASSKTGFVVFDSISTLLLYNKRQPVEKFVHLLVGKMLGRKTKGFLIAVKSSESATLIETISQFVDKSIEIV